MTITMLGYSLTIHITKHDHNHYNILALNPYYCVQDNYKYSKIDLMKKV